MIHDCDKRKRGRNYGNVDYERISIQFQLALKIDRVSLNTIKIRNANRMNSRDVHIALMVPTL